MVNNKFNPWFLMWLWPQKTIKKIVLTNPNMGFFFLASIWFLQFFFLYESYYTIIFPLHWIIMIVIVVIVSPFIGAASFYIFGWLLYLSGKMLKGKALPSHIRSAFAWSRIPLIIDLVIWFVVAVFFTELIFARTEISMSFIFTNLVALATSIWSFVLLVLAIQEVQKFSLAKAIINVILAYLIIAIVFSLIVF